MKRMQLLAMIAALFAALCCAVLLGSPYAPVIAPVMDIEEIWAIEDTREESDTPLITVLENHGMRLGYDAPANTFYCPIGMEPGDEWPQLHLTAPGAKGVQLVFVDDYSYDWRQDAVRDGYPYQVLAYTDEEFWYFDMVFTGLPIVTLQAGMEIPPHVDVPADVTISWPGEAPVSLHARAHKRGATSLLFTQKHGIKVEFLRGEQRGRLQTRLPVLGMTDDMTLLSLATDPLMIRDRLGWDLYSAMMDDDASFADMPLHYVELFVDDAYQGVYLLMKQYDYAQEMEKAQPIAPLQDSYYRTVSGRIINPDRPVIEDYLGNSYEQFYAPAGETDFQNIRPYLDMIAEEDDAAFSKKVLARMNLDSMIRYALFMQACALTDNEFNNVGMWAHHQDGQIRYNYIPWDLDMSWGSDKRDAGVWYAFDLFDRMLRLDCGGIVRRRTAEIWQEMREKAFNQDVLDVLMAQYDQALNASGAFYRNCQRWGGDEVLDTYQIYAYALDRFGVMDARIEEMAGAQAAGRQIVMGEYEMADAGELTDELRGLAP